MQEDIAALASHNGDGEIVRRARRILSEVAGAFKSRQLEAHKSWAS